MEVGEVEHRVVRVDVARGDTEDDDRDAETVSLEGARIGAVELVALSVQGRSSDWYLKLLLTDPVVVSSTMSVSGAADLTTQWSFGDYPRADVTSRSKDARGNWLPPVTATWRA